MGNLSTWLVVIGLKIYGIWFYINRWLVETMQQHVSSALGAIFGMLFLEGHTVCKAAWYTLRKYRNDPQRYDLDQWNEKNYHSRPVLLLPGAAGSWPYLGDLAIALKNAHIPVFVLDLGLGLPSEEMRKKIHSKIKEIRHLYREFSQQCNDAAAPNRNEDQSRYTNQREPSTENIPLVDIVAHSNGGNVALCSVFTEECSYIDENGSLNFRSAPQAYPYIGKMITVALPSNHIELNWMSDVNKSKDLFNVNAKFDAPMSYKKCALVHELPSNVEYIDAGHIGIVFELATYKQILRFLLR